MNIMIGRIFLIKQKIYIMDFRVLMTKNLECLVLFNYTINEK